MKNCWECEHKNEPAHFEPCKSCLQLRGRRRMAMVIDQKNTLQETAAEYDEHHSAYEKHRLQWMIAHGYTLTDLIHQLQLMIDEDLDGSDVPTSLQSLFEEWEFGYGFNGEIWPCFDEYMDCDYPNEQFDK